MKLLLDEMFSSLVAAELRARGHDAVAISERDDWKSLSDPEVVALARTEQRAVVTANVRDFRPLHAEPVAAGREDHAGIVFVPASFRLTRAATGQIVAAFEARLLEYPGHKDLANGRPGLQASTDELRPLHSAHRANARPRRLPRRQPAVGPAQTAPDARLGLRDQRRAEAEYDLRVIPVLGPGVDLLMTTVEQDTLRCGRRPSLQRIMAWHVPTTLWRTEAGLSLLLARAGGGTPADYVEELAERFTLLGISP